MRLQIDTTQKTIKVEGKVNLLDLVETLERMLPDGVWKTFSLETDVQIIWSEPIKLVPSWPYYPWWTPVMYYRTVTDSPTVTSPAYTLTTDGEEGLWTLTEGTYNIEI